ncbi:MAG: hypothetical protein CVV24_11100 [Ignavibacteriae bacterium HGW-Ignavibacteriae-3]|nr:MAG: hypothetical protein CVV24_11100 [Ignavibacteriae bacterium HGW-Ignavibacteriae-3]
MYFSLRIVLFLSLIASITVSGQNVKRDSFYVATWNVENFYDAVNDTLIDDEEFLPESSKRWTEDRYEWKADNMVKVINFMNNGCGPDILALEEVENIDVMKKLIYKMRDRDYIAVHRDSPDLRGIDVGLMYDRNIFTIEKVETIRVELPNGNPTRDILYTVLINKKSKEKIHVYVNHWPSRRGGQEKSNVNRITAANVLKKNLDNLYKTSPNSNVIILGDFNDAPDDESIEKILGAKNFDCGKKPENLFLNLAYPKFVNKEGSYLYDGKFDMIDQIIISSSFLDGKKSDYECGSFSVINPPFMVYESGKRKGGAIPTYEGNKYVGGYSDHFPVGAKFISKGKK